MISFGSNIILINKTWNSLKTLSAAKSLSIQHELDADIGIHQIFCIDEKIVYLTEIFTGVVPTDRDQTQNDTDKSDFETNYLSKCNISLSPRLPDGRARISSEKTSLSTVTFYSHNWCDKTTWYEKSVRAVNEAATNSGDNLTYTLAHKFVIDSYHAKYTNEDYIKDADGYSYRVSVSVDGYSKTEQDPHYGAGGHFTVNYVDGYIIFLSAQNPASTVNVTYHYATNSIFTIKPAIGKAIRLGQAEAQFSDDVIINDSVLFQPYGFVEAFAPQYCTTNGGPYPPGTKIPLGSPLVYKSIQDYLNDSKKSYPTYPAIGGDGWRGMQRPSIILDWEYEGDKVLRYDQGMEIRVYLQHDAVFSGNYGTVTFYCRSENL